MVGVLHHQLPAARDCMSPTISKAATDFDCYFFFDDQIEAPRKEPGFLCLVDE